MVEITPPSESDLTGQQKSAVSQTGSPQTPATKRPESPAKSDALEKASFEDAAALFSDSPKSSQTSQTRNEKTSPRIDSHSAEIPSTDQAYVDHLAWESAALQSWRKWAIFGGVATAGLLTVVSIWAFVSSSTKESMPNDKTPIIEDSTTRLSSISNQQDQSESSDHKISQNRNLPTKNKFPLPKPTEDPISEALENNPPQEKNPIVDNEPPPTVEIDPEQPTPRNLTTTTLNQSDLQPVDIMNRLQERLLQIEYKQLPLLDFLQEIMQLSTIPITLDPYALAHAERSSNPSVSVKLTDGTIETALKAVLDPLNLTYEIDSGHLLLCKTAPAANRMRHVRYSLNDLGGSDPKKLSTFANLVQSLVDPKSWQSEGGKGTLRAKDGALFIEQTEANHFRVLVLCEKLRVARDQSPLSQFKSELFDLKTRSEQARAKLSSIVSVHITQPTPIFQILHELTKATDVTFLVDWQALSEVGLNFNSEAQLNIKNQPLDDALSEMLEPLQITYKIIDAQTIRLTSQSRLAVEHEIEFYPSGRLLNEEKDKEELFKKIRSHLPEAVLFLDSPSRFILARLPQSEHQLLEQLLGQWKAEQ